MPARDDMLDNYRKAIEEIRKFLRGRVKLESNAILETIYQQRMYYRPRKVKLLLLAESHYYTSNEDYKIIITNKNYIFPVGCNRYTKFIYCLGHGEKHILSAIPEIYGRTPQFWKIFYGLFHDLSLQKNNQNIPILIGHNPNLIERLKAKLDLLENMKKNGIWLMDASPIAIAGNNPRIRKSYYREILKISSELYLKPLLAEMKPKRVLIIGKEVSRTVEPILALSNSVTIPQPQGIRSKIDLKLFHKKIYQIGLEAINHV
jgi:hypothetical protein